MEEIPLYLSLDDVLLLPQRSAINSRSEVDLRWKLGEIERGLPIIAINMDDVSGVEMALEMSRLGGMAILPRFDSPEIQADKVSEVKRSGAVTAGAVGVKDSEMGRVEMLVKAGVDHVSIDVAHGQMEKCIKFAGEMRRRFSKLHFSAGVVGTYEGAVDLFEVGVDVVRVGVGPGTICTTRIMTGSGVPQLSALIECSRAARDKKKEIWADGGTKNPGDIVKCLAAGASAVIVGSQLAGTDEAPGEKVERDGVVYKEYNASTSLAEKKEHVEKNRSDKNENYVVHVEGVESLVLCKGPVEGVIKRMSAGIRSGLSYSGARNIEELWVKRRFVRVSSLGARENGAHDVVLA